MRLSADNAASWTSNTESNDLKHTQPYLLTMKRTSFFHPPTHPPTHPFIDVCLGRFHSFIHPPTHPPTHPPITGGGGTFEFSVTTKANAELDKTNVVFGRLLMDQQDKKASNEEVIENILKVKVR